MSGIPEPNIIGLPQELCTVLQNMHMSNLDTPVWSLCHKSDSITLHLKWTRFPAKMAVKDNRATITNNKLTTGKDPHPSSGIAAKPAKPSGKKRKSPSTRKRDRLRLLNWKAKKAAGLKSQSASPTTKTQVSQAAENYTVTQAIEASEKTKSETISEDDIVIIGHTPAPRDSVDPSPNTAESLETSELTCCPQDQDSCNMAGHPSATDLYDTPDLTEYTKHPIDRHLDSGYTKFLEDVSHARELQTIYMSHYEHALENVKPCIKCFAAENIPGSFKQCSKCKLAKYCSKSCQKEHWKNSHKLICTEHCKSLAQDPISACEKIYKDQKEYIMSLLEHNTEYSNMLSNVLNSDQTIHP